jgi:hypothetical protein
VVSNCSKIARQLATDSGFTSLIALMDNCSSPAPHLAKTFARYIDQTQNPSTPVGQAAASAAPAMEPLDLDQQLQLRKVNPLSSLIRRQLAVAVKNNDAVCKHANSSENNPASALDEPPVAAVGLSELPKDILCLVATIAGGSSLARMEMCVQQYVGIGTLI